MLVADTSVLYASIDQEDEDHERCFALLMSGPVVTVPVTVVGELDWLGRRRGRPDAGALVLASIVDGSILAHDLDAEDWMRVLELVHLHADLPLGIVDASVVAVAERLEQKAVATLDRRHFSVVRPRHVRRFELLPD